MSQNGVTIGFDDATVDTSPMTSHNGFTIAYDDASVDTLPAPLTLPIALIADAACFWSTDLTICCVW